MTTKLEIRWRFARTNCTWGRFSSIHIFPFPWDEDDPDEYALAYCGLLFPWNPYDMDFVPVGAEAWHMCSFCLTRVPERMRSSLAPWGKYASEFEISRLAWGSPGTPYCVPFIQPEDFFGINLLGDDDEEEEVL